MNREIKNNQKYFCIRATSPQFRVSIFVAPLLYEVDALEDHRQAREAEKKTKIAADCGKEISGVVDQSLNLFLHVHCAVRYEQGKLGLIL